MTMKVGYDSGIYIIGEDSFPFPSLRNATTEITCTSMALA